MQRRFVDYLIISLKGIAMGVAMRFQVFLAEPLHLFQEFMKN